MLFLGLLLPGQPAAQAPDEREAQAERMLRIGLDFLAEKNYPQATRELAAIAERYKNTAAAPVACLRLAEYYFEVERDLEDTSRYLDQLTKEHATSRAAAMGYVLAGRLMLLRSGQKGLGDALGEYRRAQEYYAHHPEVAAAKYYEGEALTYGGRIPEALAAYRQVGLSYPGTPWAARAWLGQARCLVALGHGAQALDVLQRVRDGFPGTPEALTASAWNAIVYRLYLRAAPPFRFAGRVIPALPLKLRDVDAVAVGPDAVVYAAGGAGLATYEGATGKPRPGAPGPSLRALAVDGAAIVLAQKGALTPAGGRTLLLKHRKGTEAEKPLEDITAVVRTSRGDFVVADRGQRAIFRFSPTGTLQQRIDSTGTDRLAIDSRDRVAALDGEAGTVVLYSEEGKVLDRVKTTPATQKLVDLAFDAMGHLYLLDRKGGAVWVYAPGNLSAPLVSFTVPDRQPGTFRRAGAFGLDAAGRLYVYDAGAERIQVYQ